MIWYAVIGIRPDGAGWLVTIVADPDEAIGYARRIGATVVALPTVFDFTASDPDTS